MSKYIGKRVVPRHAGIWSGARAYEPLEIVLEESTGDSYISRKDVPAGTPLSQTEYWAMCQRFSEQMQLFRNSVDQDVRDMHILTNNTVRDINQSLANTDQTITQKLANTEQTVEERTEEAETKLAQGKSQMEQTAAALNARMDGIVAGSTGEGDVEIADIRTDSSGKNYATAGDAVRAITAGLPEKFEFTDKYAIRSSGNESSIELLNRAAHFTYDFTGTGYVGGFLRLGQHDDLKGRRLVAVYQNDGTPIRASILITNSRSSWGSLDGSVVSRSIGTVVLDEDHGFFQELMVDFNSESLDELLELKPESTFYLVFRLENTQVEQTGEVYIYAYNPDAVSDLFWKYYAGSEKVRQTIAEVVAARTDSRGIEYLSIGERMNLVDSFLVPALRISSVLGTVDNNHRDLAGQDGFRGVNHTYSGTIDFDYCAYLEIENISWSSLHSYFLYNKELIRNLSSYDGISLKVRIDGLGENLHIGENQRFSYYVNVVGSWSRTVNPKKTVTLKIGEDNVIPITREEIENVLNDASSGFYITLDLATLNNAVIEDMGRIRITMALTNNEHSSFDGYTTYVDTAEMAMRANYASEAGTAENATKAEAANYASSASTAIIADNFFINSPEGLLNEEGRLFSPGMETLDIPTMPLVDMRAGGQSCVRFEANKIIEGIHQQIDITMQLGVSASQVSNQGYQKNL